MAQCQMLRITDHKTLVSMGEQEGMVFLVYIDRKLIFMNKEEEELVKQIQKPIIMRKLSEQTIHMKKLPPSQMNNLSFLQIEEE